MVQEQNSGNPATAPSAAASGSTTKKDNRSENSIDSNQKTLLDFKKSLIEEQKLGETQIEKINESIEETKKIIDEERVKLEAERLKLKQINEVKDADYAKFTELKSNLIEERKRMRTLDTKASSGGGGRSVTMRTFGRPLACPRPSRRGGRVVECGGLENRFTS